MKTLKTRIPKLVRVELKARAADFLSAGLAGERACDSGACGFVLSEKPVLGSASEGWRSHPYNYQDHILHPLSKQRKKWRVFLWEQSVSG